MEQADTLWGWLSLNWFNPEVLRGFHWDQPKFLYFLIIIPLIFIFRFLTNFFKTRKWAVAYPKEMLHSTPLVFLKLIPALFFLLSVAMVCVALARPQKTNEKVEKWTEGIDIVLALDISESMKIEDFRPNRLEAAKRVAKNFISGRFHDRIGLVVFAGEAFSLSPLTLDYQLLQAQLNDIQFNLMDKGGTAIGSAMAVGTNRLRESESKSKVLIIISDGDNTAGNIDPLTAARLSSAYNIKIYSILVGKEGTVPFGKDFFGNPRYVENTVDPTTMKTIAEIGTGKFFRATSKNALEEVFAYIDKYEKAEIKENRFKDTMDFYQVYLKWGVLFFLTWFLLKNTFVNNFIVD
jgi:Ca-activated chloride channel homolog